MITLRYVGDINPREELDTSTKQHAMTLKGSGIHLWVSYGSTKEPPRGVVPSVYGQIYESAYLSFATRASPLRASFAFEPEITTCKNSW